ncbi:MAG TPA: serine/threonine-protein kinase [Thermoanaerobaculia bacterium]
MGSGGAQRFGSSGLAAGTILDHKYEIVGLLGAGGMGEVYKARHLHLHAFRCIKVMKAGLLADDTYRGRFLREARMATQVHHPNIAVVHDFSILDDFSYMVTEYIDGITLRQWSAANGRFPLPLAAEIATQVLHGLEHIHKRGLLHRDISADNVMLSYDGEERLVVKIIDLGVAKDTTVATDQTQQGMLIGNPKYMSPEQLGELPDGEQLDGRADLYCLGVVLYEMLAGVPPFVSKTPNGYIVKHLTQPAPPFRVSNPQLDLPPELEAVILRTLEKDRRRRYANPHELAAALQPFLARGVGTYTRSDVQRAQASDEATLVVAFSLDDAFQAAWEEGTTGAWRRFIEDYGATPQGKRAAELLLEAEAFEAAQQAASITALREFVQAFPEGRHRLDAEIRLAQVKQELAKQAWSDALARDSYTGFRDFLAAHGASPHGDEARRALAERMAFDTAAALDTEEAWSEYLETWSGDRHAAEAHARLEAARGREETAWAAALAAKTSSAWSAYLEEFPDGKRSGRAELYRLEGEAFEWARNDGRAALDTFVRQYPDGLWLRDAKRIVKQLTDEEDFATARALDTVAAWSLYLTTHPAGTHRDEARERLSALEDAEYAAVLASKDARRAAQFVAVFAESPRCGEVLRVSARWEQAERERTLRETDPRDFDTAWEAGTSAAWDHYLSQHGDSPRVVEAQRCRQEAAEYELASRLNTPAMWRAFVKAWPAGRHRLDAEVRIG